MFVPSTPSCSTSPSSPRVCHLSDLTYGFCHSRSFLTASLPLQPFQLFICRSSRSRPFSRVVTFAYSRSCSNLFPPCPYYCRSPAKMKRGFSVTRESLSQSINHPLRHCARSIVISPSVTCLSALYPTELYRFSPHHIVCPQRGSVLI